MDSKVVKKSLENWTSKIPLLAILTREFRGFHFISGGSPDFPRGVPLLFICRKPELDLVAYLMASLSRGGSRHFPETQRLPVHAD